MQTGQVCISKEITDKLEDLSRHKDINFKLSMPTIFQYHTITT